MGVRRYVCTNPAGYFYGNGGIEHGEVFRLTDDGRPSTDIIRANPEQGRPLRESVRPVECRVCGRRFAGPDARDAHGRRAHGGGR